MIPRSSGHTLLVECSIEREMGTTMKEKKIVELLFLKIVAGSICTRFLNKTRYYHKSF